MRTIKNIDNYYTRLEMVKELGFNADVTVAVFNEVGKKKTQANEKIINQRKGSAFYLVLASKDQFTIYSQWTVNKYEIEKFSKILGKKYITCGTLMDENNLWDVWRKLDPESA